MELLAPVGSKRSLITAIRAGANAVYIGTPDFNARLSASNINLYDIHALTDYAHKKGVKVFLALNTLIKHEEINDVVKKVAEISPSCPDAMIVQDLGIAGILRNYFPQIPLHASTQMAAHNRMGVDFLAQQGFKRAIMARELSFSELKIISKNAPIPIEIFCHGALCVCLSGLCLFSSFIGGLSGNRGRCTQPCRRRWQNKNNTGYLLSPRDLQLAEQITKLKKIGISSLKIEGRMRSSEYVYRTVKAYRLLIDASESNLPYALQEAKNILSGDTGRKKTTCLFSGRDYDMFQPQMAQCLGNLIGKIDAIRDDHLSISLLNDRIQISEGDQLRISNPETDITISFKVKTLKKEGTNAIIPFKKTNEFGLGHPVYKLADAALDQKNVQEEVDSLYKNYIEKTLRKKGKEPQISQNYTALISNQWKEIKKTAPKTNASNFLWIRFNDIQWTEFLRHQNKEHRFVWSLTKESLHHSDKIPEHKLLNITGELPPFIGQRDIPNFKQTIDKMISKGVTKWVINNISQFGFFRNAECELTAGQFLYTWNAYTAAFFSGLGIKYFTVSWEDDFLNIRKMCGPGLGQRLVIYLYGFIPIARSRILTKENLQQDKIQNISLSSEKYETISPLSLLPFFESELTLLVPEKPVSLFNMRKKLNETGIVNFGIDLSFIKPDITIYDRLLNDYETQKNMTDTVRFNFKRGVK